MTLGALNGADAPEAREMLRACCAAPAWVERMVLARPFGSPGDLLAMADRAWDALPPGEWLAAFAAHPRIGDRAPAAEAGTRAATWSTREQSRASGAATHTVAALERANHDYEARFGHRYLVFASGRSADELLADCERRLANAPAEELRIAAGHQRQITRLRLTRLLEGDE